MSMSIEYDNPVDSYDRFSREDLANRTLHELVACAIVQQANPPAEGLGADDFRIVSWVESADAKLGHALAISRPHPVDSEFIRSQFYCVDREDRRLVHPPKILAVAEEMPMEDEAFDSYRDDLIHEFDKSEFEIMLNILQKASGVLGGRSVYRDGVRQVLDHDVRLALMESQLDVLASRFPSARKDERAAEMVEHILEWSEFIETANYTFRNYAVSDEPYQEIAVQHEADDGQIYAINLQGYYRQLTGMQVLWQKDGQWEGRVYDFDPEVDEDDLADSQPDPEWSRKALLATVQDGLLIPRRVFQHYLSEILNT